MKSYTIRRMPIVRKILRFCCIWLIYMVVTDLMTVIVSRFLSIRQESVTGLVSEVLRDQSSPAFPFRSCRGFSFKQILADHKRCLCFKIASPLRGVGWKCSESKKMHIFSRVGCWIFNRVMLLSCRCLIVLSAFWQVVEAYLCCFLLSACRASVKSP